MSNEQVYQPDPQIMQVHQQLAQLPQMVAQSQDPLNECLVPALVTLGNLIAVSQADMARYVHTLVAKGLADAAGDEVIIGLPTEVLEAIVKKLDVADRLLKALAQVKIPDGAPTIDAAREALGEVTDTLASFELSEEETEQALVDIDEGDDDDFFNDDEEEAK